MGYLHQEHAYPFPLLNPPFIPPPYTFPLRFPSLTHSTNIPRQIKALHPGGPIRRSATRARPKPPLRERRPQGAAVRAAGQNNVGVDDGVAGLDEGRVARLSINVSHRPVDLGEEAYNANPSMTSCMAR